MHDAVEPRLSEPWLSETSIIQTGETCHFLCTKHAKASIVRTFSTIFRGQKTGCALYSEHEMYVTKYKLESALSPWKWGCALYTGAHYTPTLCVSILNTLYRPCDLVLLIHICAHFFFFSCCLLVADHERSDWQADYLQAVTVTVKHVREKWRGSEEPWWWPNSGELYNYVCILVLCVSSAHPTMEIKNWVWYMVGCTGCICRHLRIFGVLTTSFQTTLPPRLDTTKVAQLTAGANDFEQRSGANWNASVKNACLAWLLSG